MYIVFVLKKVRKTLWLQTFCGSIIFATKNFCSQSNSLCNLSGVISENFGVKNTKFGIFEDPG